MDRYYEGPLQGSVKSANINELGTATAAVQVETPLMRNYGDLGNNLAQLNELVDVLALKLQPVLGPDFPEPAGSPDGHKEMPRMVNSDFAESIRSDAERVQRISQRLSNLISRCEI